MLAAAAALVEKAARLSTRHWEGAADALERANALRMKSFELIEEDSQAYLAYVDAVRAAKGLEGAAQADAVGSAHALTIDVPLRLTRAAAEVVELAVQLADRGNPTLRADAVVAAILGAAAAEAAATLIRVNVEDNDDVGLREAQELAGRAIKLVRSVRTPDSKAAHAD